MTRVCSRLIIAALTQSFASWSVDYLKVYSHGIIRYFLIIALKYWAAGYQARVVKRAKGADVRPAY